MATSEAQERAVSEEERSAAVTETMKLACDMSVAAGNKAAAAMCSSMGMEPAAKEEVQEDRREQPTEGNRIIRLPNWFIQRTQKSRLQRSSPFPEGFLDYNPKVRKMVLASKEGINAFVDLEEDILMQVRDKGYAEVMMEYVDGVPKLSIVPQA